ncbi:hypothetical protein [Paenibacillus sonchi]|uniref:hypothetical protein n=1 Tax=Paenibacillus sonchi TaxID=373687 RepID=UPI001E5F9135|nr:hypothetical protein [Paenibacillus sonchi]MCE3202258.1 hypothetical protein [Paenibacillus sonchi]
MHVFSSFESSVYVELAILALEQDGFGRESIAAVPMEPTTRSISLSDSICRAEGVGVIDMAAILGTIFAVLGASFGFELRWGPILWGLIGLALGVCASFILFLMAGKRLNHTASGSKAVVILIIHCEQGDSHKAIQILKQFSAISIGNLD